MKNAKLLLLVCISVSSPIVRAGSPTATYVVPASRDGVVPATRYDVFNFSLKRTESGSVMVLFSLPEDLVGPNEDPLVLYQATGSTAVSLFLVGAGVSARCPTQPPARPLECTFSYAPSYLQVDAKSVAGFLGRKYADSPSLLGQKLDASEHFIKDPEGILIFPSPPHGPTLAPFSKEGQSLWKTSDN
jgi:hypothetical protein